MKFWGNISIGLGIRFHDYVFTHEDFIRYETRREEVISGRGGRAAYMHGGIIRRLAMDTALPTDVLNGPSGDHTDANIIRVNGANFCG